MTYSKHILPMKVGLLAPKGASPFDIFINIIIVIICLAVIGAVAYGIYKLIKTFEGFCGCSERKIETE